MDDKELLIPIERVLDDMYNPDGGMVADAARSYYYEHYATEAERKMMDHEDNVSQTIACVIMGLYAISVIAAIVIGFIQG